MIRSILESIVFRVVHAFEALKKQMRCDYKKIWLVTLLEECSFLLLLTRNITEGTNQLSFDSPAVICRISIETIVFG